MPVDFEAIRDSWMQGVNQVRDAATSEKMAALPIHSLVAKLYQLMRAQGEAEKLDQNDVTVFQSISEKKVKYYRNHKFKVLGYIKEIFSRFRNLLLVGRFQSSGQLGKDLASELLIRIQNAPRNEVPPVEPEDDSEEGEIDATGAGDGTPRRGKPNKDESSSRSSSPDNTEQPAGAQPIRRPAPIQFPYTPFPNLKSEWPDPKSESEHSEGIEIERDADTSDSQDVPPRSATPTTLRV